MCLLTGDRNPKCNSRHNTFAFILQACVAGAEQRCRTIF